MNVAPPIPVTFIASEAIGQYQFVKFGTAANTVDLCDTQGESAIGVAVEAAGANEAVSVWLLNKGGIVPVQAGAAIAVGGNITTAADGDGDPALTADIILGIALEAASGDGHVIPMLSDYAGTASA